MMLLIKGGLVVDPASGVSGARDVLIENGRIARVEPSLPADGAQVVEVPKGWIVCPGLIDMHVHLREPGQEHKETVATGVPPRWRAALPPSPACRTRIRSTTRRASRS